MNVAQSGPSWLASKLKGRLIYLTITYKQRRIKAGSNVKLDRDIMRSQTKWLLMRLDRSLLGRAGKRGKKLGRLVFHEGDGSILHFHTNIILSLPPLLERRELEQMVELIWTKSDWGRPKFDIRECYNLEGLLFYLQKEGFLICSMRKTVSPMDNKTFWLL